MPTIADSNVDLTVLQPKTATLTALGAMATTDFTHTFKLAGVSATSSATSNFPDNASGKKFLPMRAAAVVASFTTPLTVAGTVTIEGFTALTLTGMSTVGKTLMFTPLATAFTPIANGGHATAAVVASTGIGLVLTLDLYVFGMYID